MRILCFTTGVPQPYAESSFERIRGDESCKVGYSVTLARAHVHKFMFLMEPMSRDCGSDYTVAAHICWSKCLLVCSLNDKGGLLR